MNENNIKNDVAQNMPQKPVEIKIRVSKKTKEILEEFCKESSFKTYDKAILFLLSDKKEEMKAVTDFEVQKKTLEEIQRKIDLRIDSIQKRFSKYADLYFTKIIDNYNFSQQSFKEIIKTINYKELDNEQPLENQTNDVNYDLILQKDNEIKILNEQVENNFVLVKDLKNTLRDLKFIFKEKTKGFSKVYEAVLSVEDYNKIFK